MTNSAMPTFSQFKAHLDGVGIENKQHKDHLFNAWPVSKGAGMVDLNTRTGTINVGIGSKHLQLITDSLVNSGLFTLIKQNKGWSTFQTNGTDYLDTIRTVVKMIEVIDSVIPQKPVKAKAPKAKKAFTLEGAINKALTKAAKPAAKPQTAAQIMRAAEIKAKNLATMKAVTAKQNAA